MTMAEPARVFTIPPSAPFLPTLVAALRDGRLGFRLPDDPLAWADATLFLPTRRACRLARDAFLNALGGRAAVLPRIIAIGDVDEDEFIFAEGAAAEIAAEVLALPPALAGLERRMLLARLVQEWARAPAMQDAQAASLVVASPTAAFALAADLEQLLDDLVTRQVSWERLDRLVPDALDPYWALTLNFLKIARDAWPAILVERGAMEPAMRRQRLIDAEAARLERAHGGPVIAAGSTGSIPVTAKLLATIARLPRGAVILPGLDRELDAGAWALIGGEGQEGQREPSAGHPQFAMHGLLQRIGVTREQVAVLAAGALVSRDRFVSEALRPAAATDQWRLRFTDVDAPADLAAAMTGITVIEADHAEDEALAIAVALRETIEDPDTSATLVTPDRELARRVAAALDRWNVPVENSAGLVLSESPAGSFARLAAEAALSGLAPVPLLALLKHPLCRLAGGNLAAVTALEQAVLRGPRPRPRAEGLRHALTTLRQTRSSLHPTDQRTRLTDDELSCAEALVDKLHEAFGSFVRRSDEDRTFADMARGHYELIIALAREAAGDAPLFDSEDGQALALLFEDIAALGPITPPLREDEYRDLFTAVLETRILRPQPPLSVRVRILGPLEARLQTADRIVLGGLIEGVWPPQPRSDPWLSRTMRAALGLDLPERRIGLSAHDFAQALGCAEVFLTRARKQEGSPTVASRFLQRLAAVAGAKCWTQALKRGERYLALARALDRPAHIRPMMQPCPRPPRAMRPLTLAVTDIEHWLRDPYTIYAKHILKLRPLDPIDEAPGAADRGAVIHAAIGEFTERFARELPDEPYAELIAIGRRHFAPLQDFPEARAFWWPRFERIARWFCEWETTRRAALRTTFAEIRGVIEIPAGERAFRLSARADRIDLLKDGRYAILDYKTGQKRTERQVSAGLAPQLTLEGAILRHGGFREIPHGGSIATLGYVLLKGGEPAGQDCPIEFKEGAPDNHAERALHRLAELVRRFENEEVGYRSLVSPMWSTRYGDYDHLARVKEWSASGGAETDGADA